MGETTYTMNLSSTFLNMVLCGAATVLVVVSTRDCDHTNVRELRDDLHDKQKVIFKLHTEQSDLMDQLCAAQKENRMLKSALKALAEQEVQEQAAGRLAQVSLGNF